MIVDLFSPFVEDAFETRRLGELDRLGSDVISFDAAGTVQLVIQCKGFEKPVFGASQLKQCLNEIAKFKRLDLTSKSYWLALNRNVTESDDRKQILAALDDLVTSGQVEEALLLDPSVLVKKLRETILERIASWLKERLAGVSEQRREYLDLVNYIEPVPFALDDKVLINPSQHFAQLVSQERAARPVGQAGKDRKPPRILLTGSFGFGKTSCLLETSRVLMQEGLHPIYMHATSLAEPAFRDGHGLLGTILDSLLPEDHEMTTLARSAAIDALRLRVQNSDDWILLLDALDENPLSQSASRIQSLWGGIIDAGLPVLVSVRSELSELRRAEFLTHPLSGQKKLFRMATLGDWTDELIEEFLGRFEAGQSGIAHEAFSELRGLVSAGRYSDVYGDIPKRPLFLGMLAQDTWEGEASPNNLTKLYEGYFRRKFERDRVLSKHQRPFGTLGQDGMDVAVHNLIEIMTAAAYAIGTKKYKDAASELDPSHAGLITTQELNAILKEVVAGPTVAATELSAHSVLIPKARDPQTNLPLFGFAHASFEDFFVARWAFQNGGSVDFPMTPASIRFLQEMTTSS